jgi:hypothetical protein
VPFAAAGTGQAQLAHLPTYASVITSTIATSGDTSTSSRNNAPDSRSAIQRDTRAVLPAAEQRPDRA